MNRETNLDQDRRVLIPRILAPGDLIGVVAPAGPVSSETARRGVQFIESKGFRVVLGDHVFGSKGYLSGTDEQRLGNLTECSWTLR